MTIVGELAIFAACYITVNAICENFARVMDGKKEEAEHREREVSREEPARD